MDWELIKDIAIPVAAILVPSGIAIGLARSERKASERVRDDLRRDEHRRQIMNGVDYALDATEQISAAAYTDDFRVAAQLRIQAARSLARAQGILLDEHVPLGNWIAKELAIIASQGLEDKSEHSLPVLFDQVVWRIASIVQAIQDWREGDKDLQWFADAVHLPLAETPEYETTELPG